MKRSKQFMVSATLLSAALATMATVFTVSAMAAIPPNSPVVISDNPGQMLLDPTRLVPANIILLADDSGSMLWRHAPEGIGEIPRACWRGADGVLNGALLCMPADPKCMIMDVCGYPYPNPYPEGAPGVTSTHQSGTYPPLASLGVSSQQELAVKLVQAPMMAAGYNQMAYHPEVTYQPPAYGIDANGNPLVFPNMDAAQTSGWTKVGWPGCSGSGLEVSVSGQKFACPQGAPVSIDMANVTTNFPRARTLSPDQGFSLQLRYMVGSSTGFAQTQLTFLAGDNPLPMHYFKTSVKWCRYYQSGTVTADQTHITLAGSPYDEGAVFLGSASAEDCQDDRTPDYKYPYYYYPNGKYYADAGCSLRASEKTCRENHTLYPSMVMVVLDYKNNNVQTVDDNGNLIDCSRGGVVPYTYVENDANGVPQLKSGSRSCQDELVNYANWYAYYSNRMVATHTAASWALAGIDMNRWVRIGVVKVSDGGNNGAGYGSLTLTELRKDNDTWQSNQITVFRSLLESGVGFNNLGTPLKSAVKSLQSYLDKDTGGQIMCYSCQRNYILALTDGGWNDSNVISDQDNVATITPTLPSGVQGSTLIGQGLYEVAGIRMGTVLKQGATWPRPVLEDTIQSDTLADESLYAWLYKLNGGPATYDVDWAVNDLASWKHLNTQALAYAGAPRQGLAYIYTGAPGTLSTGLDENQTLALVTKGSAATPPGLAWPAPVPVSYAGGKTSKSWPTTMDDLWHATISGGFGRFSFGFDLQNNFGKMIDADLNNIYNRGMSISDLALPPSKNLQLNGACVADGNNQRNSSNGDVCGYTSSFTPGWGGTILKRTLDDPTDSTGFGWTYWSAESTLVSKEAPGMVCTMVGATSTATASYKYLTPLCSKQQMPKNATWTVGSDPRKIFTATPPMQYSGAAWGGSGTVFTYSGLAPSQRPMFGATMTEQTDVVNYLRGDWSNEVNSATGTGKYRKRESFLGDFVHSSPVVVDPPTSGYGDSTYGASGATCDPTTFVGRYCNRPRMIYAAANDGMLHAFDDNSGEELWAFVPPDLFRTAAEKGIINLTAPVTDFWTHQYYVDATPRVIDVNLSDPTNPSSAADWRTMLIGGMGKGGTAYYALDVTQGDNPLAKGVQGEGMFMWTFTDDNMGYTYGRALMVKTKAWGGKWVAILPSGINNGTDPTGAAQAKPLSASTTGDGHGHIFFVDLATGEKLLDISTSLEDGGSTTQPSGLGYIRAFVQYPADQITDAVYGGDQLGNFWRFDLSNSDPSKWMAVKLAVLADNGGHLLPVNVEPLTSLVTDSSGNQTRWVMVGTGRDYTDSDLYNWASKAYDNMPTYGLFAFKDGDANSPSLAITSSGGHSSGTYTVGDLDDISGNQTPTLSAKGGWVEYFTTAGYQVINNFDTLGGNIAYVVNQYNPNRGSNPALSTATVDQELCTLLPFNGLYYARDLSTGFALAGYYAVPNDGGYTAPIFGTDAKGYFANFFASAAANNTLPGLKVNKWNSDQKQTPVNPRRSSIRFINR